MKRIASPWTAKILFAVQATLLLTAFFSFVPLGAQQSPNALDLIAEGERLIAADRPVEARKALESALSTQPTNISALQDIALLLLLSGEDEAAAARAAKLLSLNPRDDEGLLVEAIALVNLERNAQAVGLLSPAYLRAVRQRDPLLSAAFRSALSACGSRPLCRAELQRAAKTKAPRPEPQDVLFAGQTFRASSLRKVLNAWVEELSRDPDETKQDLARVLTAVGQGEVLRGEAGGAESHFQRAVELEPCNVRARVALSQIQRDHGAITESDTNLYRIKRCTPSSEPDGLRLADEFMRLKMFVDARDVLLNLRKIGYADEHLLYREGLCQFRVGDSETAEKNFRLALNIDPVSVETKTALAVVLLATSRANQGAALLEEVVASGKATAQAYFYLADQKRGSGDLKRAEELLSVAIRLAPKDARPYAALGRLHTQEDKLQEAEDDLHRALQCDASSEIAHYYLAGLYRKEGKQTAAGDEMKLFQKSHAAERNRGIVGLQVSDIWEYPGFLPSGREATTAP